MQDANPRPDAASPNERMLAPWLGSMPKAEKLALCLSAIVAMAWIGRCVLPKTAPLFDAFVAALSAVLAYMAVFLVWPFLRSLGWVASRRLGFATAIAAGLIAGNAALLLDTADAATREIAPGGLQSASLQPAPVSRGGAITFAPTFIDRSTIIESAPATSTSSSEPQR